MCLNRRNWMLASAASVIVFAVVGTAADKREDGTKKLTLRRAGQTAGATELGLLPKPEEMTDGDAFALYTKALESLSKDLDWQKVRAWRQMPMEGLPPDEVAAVLRPFDASLPLLEQAGRCKRCDWPLTFEDDPPIDLQACRNVVFLVALRARSELARGDHASCARTLGTGLALARHLSAGPSVIHLLVGAGVSALAYGEIELYIQQPGAPSLEAALRAVPKPMFDEEHSELYGMDEASRNKVRLILRRANRHVIALQYVETLRSYATKAGEWPATLSDLKAPLPDDPVAGKPFSYQRLSETQAVLEGPVPAGGDAVKDGVRYELTMAK